MITTPWHRIQTVCSSTESQSERSPALLATSQLLPQPRHQPQLGAYQSITAHRQCLLENSFCRHIGQELLKNFLQPRNARSTKKHRHHWVKFAVASLFLPEVQLCTMMVSAALAHSLCSQEAAAMEKTANSVMCEAAISRSSKD